MIKVVIFDLWNTLIPPTIDFVHLRFLLKKGSFDIDDFILRYERAVQLKKYGSFEELRRDFFVEFGEADNVLLEEALYEIYFNRFDKIYYFPDVENALKKIKKQGYKLALLSNTESFNMKEVEEKLHLKDYFDLLAYSFVVGDLKPSTKNFEFVMNHFGVKPNECLMVGDTPASDAGGAGAVGMHNCIIERKVRIQSDHGIKAEFRIKSLDEIFRILGELNKK
ncbi:MAG: HAD family hydrolase [Candidatus Diapherotrites archaeon]|nr:HAD family hydrolase [Candidatus Diapherotrites archaeon]